MASPTSKIVLMLAGSDLTVAELRDFERWMERGESRRLSRIVEQLRYAADGRSDRVLRSDAEPVVSESASASADVIDRVQRLLFIEAGLTKAAAADALRKELGRENITYTLVPPLGKSGFSRWLEQLSRNVSPSLLLHVATRVRNDRVHSTPSDWPLRSGKP